MTKLRTSLPRGEGNGLTAISRALVEEPDQIHAVIMLIKTKSVSTDIETGDVEATAMIRRLEVVVPDDFRVAYRMLERSLEKRTGKTTLPFDLEEDLRAAFADLDLGSLAAGGDDYQDPAGGELNNDDDLDEETRLLVRMVDLVATQQRAAVSFLTRELGIGATKCRAMLDRLEGLGIVAPAIDARPRDVLVYPEDIPELVQRIRFALDVVKSVHGGDDDSEVVERDAGQPLPDEDEIQRDAGQAEDDES